MVALIASELIGFLLPYHSGEVLLWGFLPQAKRKNTQLRKIVPLRRKAKSFTGPTQTCNIAFTHMVVEFHFSMMHSFSPNMNMKTAFSYRSYTFR